MTDPMLWSHQVRLVRMGAPVFAVACAVWLWFAPTTTTFIVPERTLVDLVLIIDDSGSMADEQAALSAHLGTLLASLDGDVGLRVAVTTTTVSAERPLSFMEPGDPALTRAVQVGIDGDGNEQGLQAMLQTLQRASGSIVDGDASASFRPGAAIAFVVVSDEDDGSPMALSAFMEAVAVSRAGRQTPVVLSAVTLPSATRYQHAVAALGGRVLHLDGAWGEAIATVAKDLGTMRGRLTLPAQAMGPVEVDVDGDAVEAGCVHLGADGRTVTIDRVLVPGETVSITARLAWTRP
jgi:hypothetical protein